MSQAPVQGSHPQRAGPLVALGLAIRFVLELCMLGALAYWGLGLESDLYVKVAVTIAAPGIAATTWGRWIAPKARHRLDDPARLAVEVLLFGLAIAALLTAGKPELAIAMGALYALDTSLLMSLGRRDD